MLPLNLIETRFQTLTDTPFLDGHSYPGLPAHAIDAAELRRLLLDGTVPYAVRDQIWADLIGKTRAAEDAATLTLTLTGLAMPGLRHAANRARFAGADTDRADLESEVLTGFLHAVHTVDLERTKICGRLCQAAHTAARTLARNTTRHQQALDVLSNTTDQPSSGHVDLVLAAAITAGVIDRREAELISNTRLDGQRLTAIGRRENRTPFAMGLERRHAEARLGDWLRDRQQGRRTL